MTNVIKMSKKAFTWSVVLTTILWSMGVAALIPAGIASSATIVDADSVSTGDLVQKMNDSTRAVYYITEDYKRMYFPNAEVFYTWYENFDDVKVVDADFDEMWPPAFPNAVAPRPGSDLLFKTTASARVYAMGLNNERYHIASEEAAKALYGDDWASKVRDWTDTLTSQWTLAGEQVSAPYDGFVAMEGEKYYQMQDGKWYEIEGTLPSFVGSIEVTNFSDYETATETVTAGSLTADPSQGVTGGGTVVTPTGGDLAVSLSADTPAAGNVVYNVDGVVFAKFIFKAGDADVIVNQVKIGRSGLGSTSDFSSVTLYDGSTKLGSTKSSWHSDGYMTYNVSGGWKIPAGTEKELTITAKLSGTGTYNALGILDVSTNGETVAGVPVYGNQMSGVNVTVGGVTITGVGVTTQTKNIGTNEVTLAQFKLAVNSTEDAKFRSITLKNKDTDGNASDDALANVYLYQGGTMLAGPVSMKSDKVTFVLDDPYPIEKSKNQTFKVVGDIVSGLNQHVEFLLDATTDLVVVGDTYNTSLTVTSGDFNQEADSGTTDTTISGAELNISLSSNALDTLDDKTDVVFGTLTLSPGSTDVKITDMNIVIDETAASGEASVYDVDEFEMLDADSGAVYSGTNDSATGDYNASNETWSFTDEIYLEAGQTYTFTLRGDIPNNVSSTASYKISTTISTTNITAETVPDGDAVSNFSVGSIVGKLITVKAPTLTVKSIALNNVDAVANEEDVILYKGTMEASADNIHVEQVHFEEDGTFLTVDNWAQIGFFTLEAGEYVEQENLTNSQMTSGTLDFDTLDFTVNNGKKVTFVVKGTTASTFTGNTSEKIKLDAVTSRDTDNDTTAVVNSVGASIAADGSNYETNTRTVSFRTTGILSVAMLNSDTGFNKDRIVLAGSDFWAGKLKLKADYEDIKIEDLVVTSTQAAMYDSVEELCLYTAQSATAENLIGCTNLDSRGVATFSDINKAVPVGTNYWYMYVKTNPKSTGATGTADSEDKIEFYITTTSASNLVARGVTTGNLLSFGNLNSASAVSEIVFDRDLNNTFDEAADYQTTTTKKFYIAGTKISNVQFVSSYGGETVDAGLSGTGLYTAAILAVTTEDTDNTDANGNSLKLGIGGLRFDVDKFGSTTFKYATIERVGGSQGSAQMTTSTDNAAGDGLYRLETNTSTSGFYTVSASSSLGIDSYIDPGATAYFVVKVFVDGQSITDDGRKDWFRFDMDDLKGTYTSGVKGDDTNNNIDWYDDAVAADSTVLFNALFLDTTKLTGTKVTE